VSFGFIQGVLGWKIQCCQEEYFSGVKLKKRASRVEMTCRKLQDDNFEFHAKYPIFVKGKDSFPALREPVLPEICFVI